jgi:hypothetical protein
MNTNKEKNEVTNRFVDLSPRIAARLGGVLYILLIIFGIFAQFVGRMGVIVAGDATETAKNIMDNEFLFRFSFVSDILAFICFLLLPLALYVALTSVNKNMATLMVIFVLVSVPISFLNLLNHYAALVLLSGEGYLTAFEAGQLNAQALLYLEFFDIGYYIAGIFHGLWLLPLGYLVYKSDYFPPILGILTMVACIGFLIGSFGVFLYSGYDGSILQAVATLVSLFEFPTAIWLFIKGAKIPE